MEIQSEVNWVAFSRRQNDKKAVGLPIPIEIIQYIGSYFDHKTQCSAVLTCKQWKMFFDHETVWNSIYSPKLFPYKNSLECKNSAHVLNVLRKMRSDLKKERKAGIFSAIWNFKKFLKANATVKSLTSRDNNQILAMQAIFGEKAYQEFPNIEEIPSDELKCHLLDSTTKPFNQVKPSPFFLLDSWIESKHSIVRGSMMNRRFVSIQFMTSAFAAKPQALGTVRHIGSLMVYINSYDGVSIEFHFRRSARPYGYLVPANHNVFARDFLFKIYELIFQNRVILPVYTYEGAPLNQEITIYLGQ